MTGMNTNALRHIASFVLLTCLGLLLGCHRDEPELVVPPAANDYKIAIRGYLNKLVAKHDLAENERMASVLAS
jgi:hypothetical protein